MKPFRNRLCPFSAIGHCVLFLTADSTMLALVLRLHRSPHFCRITAWPSVPSAGLCVMCPLEDLEGHLAVAFLCCPVSVSVLGALVWGLHEVSTARIRATPWPRFQTVLIPAVRRHYRGKKKVVLCMDGCKSMNNPDKARRGRGCAAGKCTCLHALCSETFTASEIRPVPYFTATILQHSALSLQSSQQGSAE